MQTRNRRQICSGISTATITARTVWKKACSHSLSSVELREKPRRSCAMANPINLWTVNDRLGPITYGADSSNPFLGKEMGHVSNYSEETAAEIDEEIKSIICDAYDKTKKVLSEHIDLLHRLAGVLFEREKLDADEFLDVMNGKLLPSAQTAAAGIIPAEAAAPETTELPTEAQTEPEANTNTNE